MNKRHVRFFSPILIMVMLIGFISSAPLLGDPSNKSIVGVWFGARQQKETRRVIQEICHFKADGSFHIRFRKIKDGQPDREQNESGRWELKDNGKTMVTMNINGEDLPESRYITEKYLIIELTDSEMRYEHAKSGKQFRLIRVNEGFEFP